MLPNKNDIEITQDMSYSLTTRQINTPLKITNKSQQIYVYKVRLESRRSAPIKKRQLMSRRLMISYSLIPQLNYFWH